MGPDHFIRHWTAREGGAERANYQGFLYDLCDLIGVARPDVSGADAARNDYVFERAVRPRGVEPGSAPKRIDLYKRGAFVLEAKQSRLPGKPKALDHQLILIPDEAPLGRRSAARGWDVMMQNARRQAEGYVGLLDVDHPAPPFLLVCDVGHCIEVYADFSGTGRAYQHFPDRQGYRIYMEDLRHEAVRTRLKTIWDEPAKLDPAREAARVTRQIAARLAEVSRALEERKNPPEQVAHFLMRCIFTMFASSVGLLPQGRFTELLEDCVAAPKSFAPMLSELWSKMNETDAEKRFSTALRAQVPYFNGNLFKDAKVFALGREEIGELLAASRREWREVDPAIFGALLEQALDKAERKRLGAHYTPRAYVQRLVEVTVMEPLRADWQAALTVAEAAKQAGREKRAVAVVREFHHRLCATRVLDPACGTGNFLYVALELMKALEGEVLETLARLGEPESMGLDRETVDPHQFLGLELNPRAAAIAELVVWIGYLQQHYRTRTGHPGEPILRAFKNVNGGARTGFDAVLTWDGYPAPAVTKEKGRRVETYPNARRPDWPEAEFIVGNPPFIGSKRLSAYLTPEYVAALRSVEVGAPHSVDYVMYWWRRAAELVSSGRARRAGLVSTNTITQFYNRRLTAALLDAPKPISFIWATPDHPWVDVEQGAHVRVAFGCMAAGSREGVCATVTSETGVGEDGQTSFSVSFGKINEKLRIGRSVYDATSLSANDGLCWQGVKLVGDGFRLDEREYRRLRACAPKERAFMKPYLTGMRLNRAAAAEWVIDFHGLDVDEARRTAPHLYQHLVETVKRYREANRDAGFRSKWWTFGRPRPEMRDAIARLRRYIVTSEVSKHRFFAFVDDPHTLPDGSLIVIASEDAWRLAVLSSTAHIAWTLWGAGVLEDRPRYQNQLSFDPFPFPETPAPLRAQLAAAGEELDALRKRVRDDHPDITLTALYNVLARVRSGAPLTDKDEDVRRRGLVLILQELHDRIDRLTLEAYGWPQNLADDEIVERLVALNAERAQEEARGLVRWLRPDFQRPRYGGRAAKPADRLPLERAPAAAPAGRPVFPKDPFAQPLAIEAALARAGRPLGSEDLARVFEGGGRGRRERVDQALATLALYGRVTALGDGRFAASRHA